MAGFALEERVREAFNRLNVRSYIVTPGLVSALVARENPNRVVLIFNMNESLDSIALHIIPNVAGAGGIRLQPDSRRLELVHSLHGKMTQIEWFAISPAGDSVSVFEVVVGPLGPLP